MSAPSTRGTRGGRTSRGAFKAPAAPRGRGSTRAAPRASTSTSTSSRGRGRGGAAANNVPASADGLLQRMRTGTVHRGSDSPVGASQRGRGRGHPTAAARESTASVPPARGHTRGRESQANPFAIPKAVSSAPVTRTSSPAAPFGNKDAANDAFSKFQVLKQKRENERAKAIRDGFLADPEKKMSLDKAITPVGTCTEMCPEFERIERIVQNMVDKAEKAHDPNTGKDSPFEEHMVKRFRRSAAGNDEQLPSDIRTPETLKRTLDYLLDKVVGGGERLAIHHKFVWDRTRAIRNDFSIQQVSKHDHVRLAVACYERIARFHILSLHQLCSPDNLYEDENFDAHQEREQLNNTLLSLLYYYDDHRDVISFPNEGEFRAYCIIFELQSQAPDIEDRMQSWPPHLLRDMRVQTALKLYAAAGNTMFDQGPLRPMTPSAVAQNNFGRFWKLLASGAVPYVMACVAEIYFGYIRFAALQALWGSCKGAPKNQQATTRDWTLSEVTALLGFDEDEETMEFCDALNVTFNEDENGGYYLNLMGNSSPFLDQSSIPSKQLFSHTYVEKKRYHRTLTAVINGATVGESIREGWVEAAPSGDDEDVEDAAKDDQSMFFPETKQSPFAAPSPFSTGVNGEFSRPSAFATSSPFDRVLNPRASPFSPAKSVDGEDKLAAAVSPFATTKPIEQVNPFIKPASAVQAAPSPFSPHFSQPRSEQDAVGSTSLDFSNAPRQSGGTFTGLLSGGVDKVAVQSSSTTFSTEQPPKGIPSTSSGTPSFTTFTKSVTSPFPSGGTASTAGTASNGPQLPKAPVEAPDAGGIHLAAQQPNFDESLGDPSDDASATPTSTKPKLFKFPAFTPVAQSPPVQPQAFQFTKVQQTTSSSDSVLVEPGASKNDSTSTQSSSQGWNFTPPQQHTPSPDSQVNPTLSTPKVSLAAAPATAQTSFKFPAFTPITAQPSGVSSTALLNNPKTEPAEPLTLASKPITEALPQASLPVQSTTPPNSPPKPALKPTFTARDRERLIELVARMGLTQSRGIMEQFIENNLPAYLSGIMQEHQQEVIKTKMAPIRARVLIRKFGMRWYWIADERRRQRLARERRLRKNTFFCPKTGRKIVYDDTADIMKEVAESNRMKMIMKEKLDRELEERIAQAKANALKEAREEREAREAKEKLEMESRRTLSPSTKRKNSLLHPDSPARKRFIGGLTAPSRPSQRTSMILGPPPGDADYVPPGPGSYMAGPEYPDREFLECDSYMLIAYGLKVEGEYAPYHKQLWKLAKVKREEERKELVESMKRPYRKTERAIQVAEQVQAQLQSQQQQQQQQQQKQLEPKPTPIHTTKPTLSNSEHRTLAFSTLSMEHDAFLEEIRQQRQLLTSELEEQSAWFRELSEAMQKEERDKQSQGERDDETQRRGSFSSALSNRPRLPDTKPQMGSLLSTPSKWSPRVLNSKFNKGTRPLSEYVPVPMSKKSAARFRASSLDTTPGLVPAKKRTLESESGVHNGTNGQGSSNAHSPKRIRPSPPNLAVKRPFEDYRRNGSVEGGQAQSRDGEPAAKRQRSATPPSTYSARADLVSPHGVSKTAPSRVQTRAAKRLSSSENAFGALQNISDSQEETEIQEGDEVSLSIVDDMTQSSNANMSFTDARDLLQPRQDVRIQSTLPQAPPQGQTEDVNDLEEDEEEEEEVIQQDITVTQVFDNDGLVEEEDDDLAEDEEEEDDDDDDDEDLVEDDDEDQEEAEPSTILPHTNAQGYQLPPEIQLPDDNTLHLRLQHESRERSASAGPDADIGEDYDEDNQSKDENDQTVEDGYTGMYQRGDFEDGEDDGEDETNEDVLDDDDDDDDDDDEEGEEEEEEEEEEFDGVVWNERQGTGKGLGAGDSRATSSGPGASVEDAVVLSDSDDE